GQAGHFLHNFLHEMRYYHAGVVTLGPGVGIGDLDALLAGLRVVRLDDAADAVLERRDDAAAVGVVLRIGAEDQAQVQVQPDGVAADLDVALLQDVEQADLDLGAEVGQLVHAEDAAVGPRDQAEVHGQFARQVSAFGVLDHVDLADQVGDGHVRGGGLLLVTAFAADPVDGRRV